MLLSAGVDASHFLNLSNNNSNNRPIGCFCSLWAEPCSAFGPSTNTLQQPPAPTPLPSTVPTSCSKSQRARIHLHLLLSDAEKRGRSLRRGVPKTILVLPDCSLFRRLLCSAPVLQKLQPNFSLRLRVPVAGKSSAGPSVTFFFQLFFLWVEDTSSSAWQGQEDLTCGFICPGEISWGCRYPRDILACSEFKGVVKSHLPGACKWTGADPGNVTPSCGSWHSPVSLSTFFCGCRYCLF